MTGAEWAVLLAGVTAIAWLNWYFFIAPAGGGVAAMAEGGVSHVVVAVKGGYAPAVIRAKAGQPLRLTFDRQETNSCSEEVVIPDFGIRKFLPPFSRTTVEVTPKEPGEYGFSCGMSMLHGTIIAE